MAYSFNLLTPEFSAAHVRGTVETMEAKLAAHGGKGWACWSAGNHDVVRVMSRWGKGRAGPDFAKLVLALMATLRGSLCVYQGEELALGEAELPFEALRDPFGIRGWPDFKGRDGCRTPIPWRHDAPFGGFSAHTPWLPMAPQHLPLAVDVQERDSASALAFFRAFLAWRRRHAPLRHGEIRFFDAAEPVLAFERRLGAQRCLLLFNLGWTAQTWQLPGGLAATALDGHGLDGAVADGRHITLPPCGGWIGRLRDVPPTIPLSTAF